MFKDRLKSSITRKELTPRLAAAPSPLFNIRQHVEQTVTKLIRNMKAEIMSAIIGGADLLRIKREITPIKGIDYFDGDQGDPGKPGKDGRPGAKGDKGDSIKGDRGDPGTAGKDGSPDTASQVVAKVNTAKGVAISSITGLQDALDALKTAISKGSTKASKGGGGMGNWLHESFATSSATLSVTTASHIAAGGMAHLLRYQGQVLAYGSQYTISNHTFTFSFTLDDDTTVDISYVRS